MSFPFIVGLSDQPTTTVNGLVISVPMSQVPNNPNWIQGDCASYVHVDNYDGNVFCNLSTPPKEGEPVQLIHITSKESFLSSPNLSPTAVMPVFIPNGTLNVKRWDEPETAFNDRVVRSFAFEAWGPTTIFEGTAYDLSNVYPILASEGREHYIGLVSIVARNAQGTTWSGYYNNYPAVRNNYPYIQSATITYWYKEDLASTAAPISCPISFVGIPKNVTIYGAAGGDINYYKYTLTGQYSSFLGNTLLNAPRIVTQLHSQENYFSGFLYDADGFPYEHAKLYPGDIANSIHPFIYYEYEDVEKAANARGLPWAGGSTGLREWHGRDTTSTSCHLPVVNMDGTTTTNGYTGTNIGAHYDDAHTKSPTSPLVNTAGVTFNPVDDETPEYPTLKPGYEEDLQAAAPTFTGVGCFGTYYALTRLKVNNLNDFLWTLDDEGWDGLIKSLLFWGNNPADAVMSFKVYPFDVAIATGSTRNEPIMFGKLNTSIYAIRLNDNSICILDLGETWINRSNLGLPNDFKAFSPYAIATLYIPYIGAVEFDINNFMDAVMKIQMVVDITTGTCTAIVYNNGMPYMYIPGTIGVDIPITQQSVTSIAAAVMETNMNSALHGSAGLLEIGVGELMNASISGNNNNEEATSSPGDETVNTGKARISGAASSGISGAAGILSKIFVNTADLVSRGSNSPGANMALSQYCYIIISQQEPIYPRNYAHTCGYPCHVSDRLENFTGFTKCQNVDTSGIACTEAERSMIKSILESGVYL